MRYNCCQASTLPSQDVADEPSYDDDAPSASGDGAQFGLSDAEFETLLARALQQSPMYHEYLTVFQAAPKIMTEWRQRYRGNPALWKRLFQKDRVIKEFVEAAPIIDAVKRLVDDAVLVNGQQFTIFDLACGRGYLSMTLSHLLPPEKVKKLVLVDKQWPMHNMTPKPHHISWTHIYGSHKKVEDQSIPCYFDTWPIELHTSKMDLKSSQQIRNMEDFHLRDKGPIILVAVHLCGTLSLKAVQLFNNNPEIRFFCLKPCCLPGMVHAKRHEIFRLGNHSFDSKLVCMAGKWKKNVWNGPPRTTTKAYFERWAENLFLGIDSTDTAKIQKSIMVQRNGGYQNEFLFAERLPETNSVWDALRSEERVE
ncbi:hypothetical protein ACHAWX_006268 [Stephanocyclus meneghinianus]